MIKPIKVVFFGTSDYAVWTLKALSESPLYRIVAVVTQPDRPVGRKQTLMATPVKQAALELHLDVIEHPRDIPANAADVGVLVYYGKILSAKTLQLFPHGIINIHPSLLPAWRGPSPAQAALLAGDTHTGVTIMKLDSGMDTGPILTQGRYEIRNTDTATDLYDALFALGNQLLLSSLPEYVSGNIVPQPQANTGASYSHIISREDGRITAHTSPQEIINALRAFHPWPGVYCVWQNRRVKIVQAHMEGALLVLDTLQMEGKKPMPYEEFMRGYPKFSLSDIG